MNDQNRWSDDRYGDRYRQDDQRTENYRAGDPYGQGYGQDRYRADRNNPDRNGYGENSRGGDAYLRGGQRYGQNPRGTSRYEERSFDVGERGHEPYDAAYGAYGEEVYRDRRYGSDPRDSNRYDGRQASGAMLHQGYRAPFAGVRGDAQSYSNAGYRTDDDHGRYDGARQGQYDRGQYGGRGDERGWWDQTRDEVSSWFGDDQAAQRRQLDDARHGQHSGRGPKGYTRSDDRIREDVNDRLTFDRVLDASDIEVKASNGEVTLDGHVESREAKRRAEDIADRVSGVKHVQNNLRVIEHQTASTFATSGATSQLGSGQTGATHASSGQVGSGQVSGSQAGAGQSSVPKSN